MTEDDIRETTSRNEGRAGTARLAGSDASGSGRAYSGAGASGLVEVGRGGARGRVGDFGDCFEPCRWTA